MTQSASCRAENGVWRHVGLFLAGLCTLCGVVVADAGDGAEFEVVAGPPGAEPMVVMEKRPVTPGERYALAWEMMVKGERRWRFQSEFAGVILSFEDDAGNPVGTIKRHTSCYDTVGARPAWVLFRAPESATRVSASFAIVMEARAALRFDIRSVRLVSIDSFAPTTDGNGVLSIAARDETGAVTPARLYVRDAEGGHHASPFAFTCDFAGKCFYLQEPEVGCMEAPPGRYEITGIKGFEYDIARTTATVAAGQTTSVSLVLKRRFNLDQRGWFPGDHQTHLFRHASSLFPMIDLADVYTIAKAEGLTFLPFMGKARPSPATRDYSEPGFIALCGSELTRDLWGHVCPIGVGAGDWPPMTTYSEAWPMNYDLIVAAARIGGAIAYAHPYGPLRWDKESEAVADLDAGLIAREFPIDLALGLPCTLDLLTKEDARGIFDLKVRDYFRLLNLGFRAGVSGSTDFHLDQARQPIGGMRTYVQVDELTWPNVAEAYREGRTFTTNAPVLLVTANGQGPGSTLSLSPGDEVECKVEASSLWGIDAVELWLNGEIAAKLDARNGSVSTTVPIKVAHSGWLLAVAKGRPVDMVMSAPEDKPAVPGQYAMSSPIYLVVEGRPLPPDPESAGYFLKWVDAVQEAFDRQCRLLNGQAQPVPVETRNLVLDRLERARDVLRSKQAAAG